MQTLANSISKVLAIQNFGSSGSKLLHALFDDHPNILAVPSLYMIGFFTFWPKDQDRDLKSVIDEFVKFNSYWFDPKGYHPWGTDRMGQNGTESTYVKQDEFVKNLNVILGEKTTVSRKNFFQAIYVAYALAAGRKLNLQGKDYIILYPHHTSKVEVAFELTKDFPETFFLHCYREPIQTLGSTFKMGATRWGGFCLRACTTAQVELSIFLQDTYIAPPCPHKIHGYTPLVPGYDKRSIAIRLEDLVQNPERVLKTFCEWIEISWDDVLLSSTYNGKTWWNRPESARVTGFSQKPLTRKHNDVFNNLDRYRLEILLFNLKNKMEYPTKFQRPKGIMHFVFYTLLLIPFKMELLSIFPSKFSMPNTKSFLFNRFFETVKTIIKNRSLHGTDLKKVLREQVNFFLNWLLLTPVRSYIGVRVVLFKSLKQLSSELSCVVPIIKEKSKT